MALVVSKKSGTPGRGFFQATGIGSSTASEQRARHREHLRTRPASLGIRLAGLTARVAGGYNRAGNVADNTDGRMMGSVRTHLVRMLDWEESHVGFDRAVAELPAERRGATANEFAHSPWQLLEHIRLAQADLLAFCLDPAYVHALQWPDDYWPASPEPPGDAAWDESVARVRADRERLKQLVADPTLDLAQPVPTGEAHQTYLRAVLVVADHRLPAGQLELCGARSARGRDDLAQPCPVRPLFGQCSR